MSYTVGKSRLRLVLLSIFSCSGNWLGWSHQMNQFRSNSSGIFHHLRWDRVIGAPRRLRPVQHHQSIDQQFDWLSPIEAGLFVCRVIPADLSSSSSLSVLISGITRAFAPAPGLSFSRVALQTIWLNLQSKAANKKTFQKEKYKQRQKQEEKKWKHHPHRQIWWLRTRKTRTALSVSWHGVTSDIFPAVPSFAIIIITIIIITIFFPWYFCLKRSMGYGRNASVW